MIPTERLQPTRRAVAEMREEQHHREDIAAGHKRILKTVHDHIEYVLPALRVLQREVFRVGHAQREVQQMIKQNVRMIKPLITIVREASVAFTVFCET